MEHRQVLISLVLFCTLLLAPAAARPQPSELFACVSSGGGPLPACADVKVSRLIILRCNREYTTFRGRIRWGPLRYVGPITIEINAKASVFNRFPLYVEIVPLNDRNPCLPQGSGFLVMTARGGLECNPWDSVENLDLSSFLEVGALYALQVVFFDGGLVSPALDCIRLTTVASTAPVEATTWTHIKQLFR